MGNQTSKHQHYDVILLCNVYIADDAIF